jgi:hypothetical protein
VHGGGDGAGGARGPPSARETWAMLLDAARAPLMWVFIVVGFLWGERPAAAPVEAAAVAAARPGAASMVASGP